MDEPIIEILTDRFVLCETCNDVVHDMIFEVMAYSPSRRILFLDNNIIIVYFRTYTDRVPTYEVETFFITPGESERQHYEFKVPYKSVGLVCVWERMRHYTVWSISNSTHYSKLIMTKKGANIGRNYHRIAKLLTKDVAKENSNFEALNGTIAPILKRLTQPNAPI